MKAKVSANLDHLLATLSPFISTASGAAAAWLLVHERFLGLFRVSQASLTAAISEAVIFAITSAGTFAIQHRLIAGIQQRKTLTLAAKLGVPVTLR